MQPSKTSRYVVCLDIRCNRLQVEYALPDSVQQLHVQQPSTYVCKTRGC